MLIQINITPIIQPIEAFVQININYVKNLHLYKKKVIVHTRKGLYKW
jgi:hypothetical protein